MATLSLPDRIWKALLGVAMVCLAVLSCRSEPLPSEPPVASQPMVTATRVPTATPVSRWKAAVHGLHEVEQYGERTPAEGHRFYQAYFTIENVGHDLMYLFPRLWRAEAEWQEYTYPGAIDARAGYYPPGFPAFGQAFFDVPAAGGEPVFVISSAEERLVEFGLAASWPPYPALPHSGSGTVKKMQEPFTVDKYWEVTPISSTFVKIAGSGGRRDAYVLLLKARVKNLYGHDHELINSPTLRFQVFVNGHPTIVTTDLYVWSWGAQPTIDSFSYTWFDEPGGIETLRTHRGGAAYYYHTASPLAPGLERTGYFWLMQWPNPRGTGLEHPLVLIAVMPRTEVRSQQSDPVAWAVYQLEPSMP